MVKRVQKAKVVTFDGAKIQSGNGMKEEQIVSAIYNAVMEHRLPPGTKLTEAAFSSFFNVSRTVIRKALFRLAQRNVIELRPNRGAIVACPTIEETHAVFEARCIIEREIIKTVCQNIKKDQLRQLRSMANKELKAQESGDRHTLVRLTGDFHVLLSEFSGNSILKGFLTELVSRTSLIIALYEAPGAPVCTSHDHWELIELIEKKDVEGAAKAMVEHLDEIESRLNLTKTEDSINLTEVFKRVS